MNSWKVLFWSTGASLIRSAFCGQSWPFDSLWLEVTNVYKQPYNVKSCCLQKMLCSNSPSSTSGPVFANWVFQTNAAQRQWRHPKRCSPRWTTSWKNSWEAVEKPFFKLGMCQVISQMPIPIGSMYSIFTYIYHKIQLNVGKYTIHGSYGII